MKAARAERIISKLNPAKANPRRISRGGQSFIKTNKPIAQATVNKKAIMNSLVAANWSSDLPAKGGLSPSKDRRVLSKAGTNIKSKPAISHPFLVRKIFQSVVSIKYPN